MDRGSNGPENRGAEVRRIAWCSQKGGVGKSTSAINSAVALARSGRRVLLVDLDPQANASMVLLEGQGAEPPTIGAVLLGRADAEGATRRTRVPGLDIIPAAADLADVNAELVNLIGRETRLRAALEGIDYDVLVIDTPPTSSLLVVNALVAVLASVVLPARPRPQTTTPPVGGR